MPPGRRDQARVSTWRLVTRRQRRAIAASVASLALLYFDQTAVVAALPVIRKDFEASVNTAQWTVTVYLLALAMVMPLVGRLGGPVRAAAAAPGGSRHLRGGLALCAVAPSLPVLIAVRFVQGLGGAVMQPMALSVGARGILADHRGRVIGFLSSGGTTFLVVGPPSPRRCSRSGAGDCSSSSTSRSWSTSSSRWPGSDRRMDRVVPVSPVRDTAWLLLGLSATVLGFATRRPGERSRWRSSRWGSSSLRSSGGRRSGRPDR